MHIKLDCKHISSSKYIPDKEKSTVSLLFIAPRASIINDTRHRLDRIYTDSVKVEMSLTEDSVDNLIQILKEIKQHIITRF